MENNVYVSDDQLTENNGWFSKNTVKHNLAGTGKIRKTVKDLKKIKSAFYPQLRCLIPECRTIQVMTITRIF